MAAVYLGPISAGMAFLCRDANDIAAPYIIEAIVVDGHAAAIDPVESDRVCVIGAKVIGVTGSDKKFSVIVTSGDSRYVNHNMPEHVLRERFFIASWRYDQAEITKILHSIPHANFHEFGECTVSVNAEDGWLNPNGSATLDRLVCHLVEFLPRTSIAIEAFHASPRPIIRVRWQDGAAADQVVRHLRDYGISSIFSASNIDIHIDRRLSKLNFAKAAAMVQEKVGHGITLPTAEEFYSGSCNSPREVIGLLREACLSLNVGLAFPPHDPC